MLRADKSYFFTADEAAFLAYRVVSGVAIVSGDPIGPRDRLDELVGRFVEHAHDRDWRVAILGASEGCLPLYAAHGLHSLYHGDEAIVDTATFSLDGRPIRKVRQSVHRLEQAGYRAHVLRPSALDADLRNELQAVANDWRGERPERGFVMALDALFALGRRRRALRRRVRAGRPRRGVPPLRGLPAARRCPCRRCLACARRRTGSTSG